MQGRALMQERVWMQGYTLMQESVQMQAKHTSARLQSVLTQERAVNYTYVCMIADARDHCK